MHQITFWNQEVGKTQAVKSIDPIGVMFVEDAKADNLSGLLINPNQKNQRRKMQELEEGRSLSLGLFARLEPLACSKGMRARSTRVVSTASHDSSSASSLSMSYSCS